MKNAILLLAFLLLAGIGLAQAQPKLEFVGGAKFNLGSLYRGEMAERSLTLKNSGTDTLVISRVDVSCGCTGTLVSNDHIAPGDTGNLKITFNSKNFRGQVHKTVTVNSNDPAQPQALVQFEGNVVENVVVTPEYLWFQDAEVGAKNIRVLTIKNEEKANLKLRKFSTDLKGLELTLPSEPVQPGATVQLPVSFTPAQASPVLAERMTISTSDPHQADLVIAIYGNAKTIQARSDAGQEHPEAKGPH